MSSVSFRASARTIDHLGKGQIADTPTAVSELWKNAYDAYARTVALHMFDGDAQSAAVIDDGCGMTLDQIINSWLVIGTNSKTKKDILPDKDRFGLDVRLTQGEKGIGRLSAAFLAPVTFLVTKKMGEDFSAVLIDWRLFENPYLSLSDISLPYQTFHELDNISNVFSHLLKQLKENLCLTANLMDESEIRLKELEVEKVDNFEARSKAKKEIQKLWIRNAWHTLSTEEIRKSENNSTQTTEDSIRDFCDKSYFNKMWASTWKEYLNKVLDLDGDSHGTALFLLDINRELSLLTNRKDKAVDDYELTSIRDVLVDTLKAFIDPFKKTQYHFNYEIKSFSKNSVEETILNNFDEFGYEYFQMLENRVEGIIDEKGWFRGNVVVWGEDIGEVTYPPTIGFETGHTKVGKFEIKLGAIEQANLSSLDQETNKFLSDRIEKDHGILIFRDGLRVLPYGRVDYDFFGIEERRGTNAGRHYWANRRMIGQISLDQINNSNLKDKAGREGFIKNQAARELKEIVISHLVNFADKHFGGKSDERKLRLEIYNKEKVAQKDAQKKAKRQTQKSFKQFLVSQRPNLESKLTIARNVYSELERGISHSLQTLEEFIRLINELESERGELKTPTKPSKTNDTLENSYREYRDIYREFSELLRASQEKINHLEASISIKAPFEIAKRNFDSKQALLNNQISKYEKLLNSKTNELATKWKSECSIDRGQYHKDAINVLEAVNSKIALESNLNTLESIYLNLADSFTVKYESLLRALDRLEQGVNLESAFSISENERTFFEDKAKKLQSLAQLGISVEVMGHELEQQDQLITRGLNSLPSEIKEHPGFKTAYNAHKQLTSQIRFLSPLKLSGYQARQDIDGKMIEGHIQKLFRDRFERQGVELIISEKFKKIVIRDLPSRIYPVFVNIINNALYWVSLSQKRKVQIDLINNLVVIANTGPKVDEDDIENLFELFYSKRANGHGVGLYLCRENLGIAHHKIWYAQASEEKIFQDATNFIIEFNGMEIKN